MAENLLVIFSCSSVKFELSDNCVFELKNIMFEITPIIFLGRPRTCKWNWHKNAYLMGLGLGERYGTTSKSRICILLQYPFVCGSQFNLRLSQFLCSYDFTGKAFQNDTRKISSYISRCYYFQWNLSAFS